MKQRTFTQEEVTQLFLGLWAVGDALLVGDTQLALALHMRNFQLIPDTKPNEDARTRARRLRLQANRAKQKGTN